MTVLGLSAEIGETCAKYQDENRRKLPCKRVQCNEVWSFVGAKKRMSRRARDIARYASHAS